MFPGRRFQATATSLVHDFARNPRPGKLTAAAILNFEGRPSGAFFLQTLAGGRGGVFLGGIWREFLKDFSFVFGWWVKVFCWNFGSNFWAQFEKLE